MFRGGLFSVLAARPNRNRLTTYTALMSAERSACKHCAALGGRSRFSPICGIRDPIKDLGLRVSGLGGL